MRNLSIISVILAGLLVFMTGGIMASSGVEESADAALGIQQLEAQFSQAMEQTQKILPGLNLNWRPKPGIWKMMNARTRFIRHG